jgi:glycosyltransferase involved in cell wall biosynthesis
MIWFVPIEPYEERYTEQWYRWFKDAFEKEEKEFFIVNGERLTDKIEEGQVLDVYGTHYYKFSQLMVLMDFIRRGLILDDDIIFFADLWFPGIESLQYIRNMTGKKFKIQGVLHAGTWDSHDFTFLNGMRPWAKDIEQGWLKFFDKVYLGSKFHKDLIEQRNQGITAELVVTGLPFEASEVRSPVMVEESKIVVFPHRLDPEKRPDLFDELAKRFEDMPEWKFLKTKEHTKTKEEYYRLLGISKIAVSFAEQETFGYAMLEAIANYCYPIVPCTLSYSTMDIYDGFRVNGLDEAEAKIRWVMNNPVAAMNQVIGLQKKLKEFETVNFVRKIC